MRVVKAVYFRSPDLKQENSDWLNEERITFCGVSVKDQFTKDDLKIRNCEWTNTNSGVQISNKNPYLVLLMSLTTKGPPDHLQRLPEHADPQQASQVFHGLNKFPCLTRKGGALTKLLDVEPDLPKLYEGQQDDRHWKMFDHTSNPLVYRQDDPQ
ncbi:hypothetical protein PCASD_20911 [Puccinia coronata f. sp. avenae]|uniref:Uncharacterized protein n=1 Tax=Puccinia coronata f. sp. avenae TaxID=200324 RepID=A0A2N5TVU4_9BASI|nr:hypothetical protein PCASD_20911 [Puccinia coronata f. sp. avenae]